MKDLCTKCKPIMDKANEKLSVDDLCFHCQEVVLKFFLDRNNK